MRIRINLVSEDAPYQHRSSRYFPVHPTRQVNEHITLTRDIWLLTQRTGQRKRKCKYMSTKSSPWTLPSPLNIGVQPWWDLFSHLASTLYRKTGKGEFRAGLISAGITWLFISRQHVTWLFLRQFASNKSYHHFILSTMYKKTLNKQVHRMSSPCESTAQ